MTRHQIWEARCSPLSSYLWAVLYLHRAVRIICYACYLFLLSQRSWESVLTSCWERASQRVATWTPSPHTLATGHLQSVHSSSCCRSTSTGGAALRSKHIISRTMIVSDKSCFLFYVLFITYLSNAFHQSNQCVCVCVCVCVCILVDFIYYV